MAFAIDAFDRNVSARSTADISCDADKTRVTINITNATDGNSFFSHMLQKTPLSINFVHIYYSLCEFWHCFWYATFACSIPPYSPDKAKASLLSTATTIYTTNNMCITSANFVTNKAIVTATSIKISGDKLEFLQTN